MGKYPPSKLRMAFSEWHYRKLNPMSTGMDIDFIETKLVNGSYIPIAWLEIQRFGDSLTRQQEDVYAWLKVKTKLPVYIIQTSEEFNTFKVRKFGIPEFKTFSEFEFIRWLDGLRGYKSWDRGKKISLDRIKSIKNPRISKSIQRDLRILEDHIDDMTDIQIQHKTKYLLNQYKRKDETYDDIIIRLLHEVGFLDDN